MGKRESTRGLSFVNTLNFVNTSERHVNNWHRALFLHQKLKLGLKTSIRS